MLLLEAAAAVSCCNAVHRVGLPCARTARPAPKGSSGAAAAQGPPASSKRRILDTETSRVVLTIKACKQRNRTTQSRWVPLASLTRENQSNQCEIDACVPAERIPKARGAPGTALCIALGKARQRWALGYTGQSAGGDCLGATKPQMAAPPRPSLLPPRPQTITSIQERHLPLLCHCPSVSKPQSNGRKLRANPGLRGDSRPFVFLLKSRSS